MYSATHAETVEELLQWPWRRFEAFYSAFVKRRVVESLERRKEAMVQALWANSNYDDDKGSRQNAIQEIEESFTGAIESIDNPQQETEIDKSDPFFAPSFKALDALEVPEDMKVEAVIEQENDYSRFIDQG